VRRSLAKQKNAFKSRLNCTNSMSGFCSVAGRLFHGPTFGPATENLLSPSRVYKVRGTVRELPSAERRQGVKDSQLLDNIYSELFYIYFADGLRDVTSLNYFADVDESLVT